MKVTDPLNDRQMKVPTDRRGLPDRGDDGNVVQDDRQRSAESSFGGDRAAAVPGRPTSRKPLIEEGRHGVAVSWLKIPW